MLSSREEYQMMFEAEEKLWWYRVLHEKILKEIVGEFGERKNLRILDAGCGTGGLMLFLISNGYTDIEGFDFSEDAVSFCLERKLKVQKIDLTDFDSEFPDATYDVIINNDVLYQFDDKVIIQSLRNLERKIHPQGVLITNNNAFNIFYGTHDIAVGGQQRFTKFDFDQLLKHTSLKISYHTYWSFFLSPLILSVRLLQQVQLKFNLIDKSKVKSDVSVPSNFLNQFFYQVVKFEELIFRTAIFGSSLFLVIKKEF